MEAEGEPLATAERAAGTEVVGATAVMGLALTIGA
jgi:hypothetical protein